MRLLKIVGSNNSHFKINTFLCIVVMSVEFNFVDRFLIYAMVQKPGRCHLLERVTGRFDTF